MPSKYCSSCIQRYPISSFLLDPSNVTSREYTACKVCRNRQSVYRAKRKALGPLNPNIPTKKHTNQPETPFTGSKLSIPPPENLPTESEGSIRIPTLSPIPPRPEPSVRAPTPPPILPQTPSFLPTDQ
jgi:hypothetical protein